MSMSGGGADSVGNAPQMQDEEYDKKSNLYATRDNPGAADKSKIQNEGVPVDSARTGMPIVILGKSGELGKAGNLSPNCHSDIYIALFKAADQGSLMTVAAFLQPTYLVIYQALSIPDLMKKLPTLSDPRPLALFLGGGFSQDEQEDVESQVAGLGLGDQAPRVIKSIPGDKELTEKYSSLPMEDAVPHIIKERLDKVDFVTLPSGPERVSVNSV